MTTTSPVLKQIAGLPKLSQAELKALWREYFGVEPPAYRRGFLIRGLAHRIQELTYGGSKPAYQARLDAMIAGDGEAERRRPARAAAAPGGPPARGHQAAPRVAGRDPRGHGHRRRLRAPGQALPEPLGGRPRDHRHPVVRAAVLRPAQDRERRDEPARGQAQGPLRGLHAASPARRVWSWPSTASTPSARPALPTSTASAMKAGSRSTTATTTAGTAAARWSARRCSG